MAEDDPDPVDNLPDEDDDVPNFFSWLQTLYDMNEESPNE